MESKQGNEESNKETINYTTLNYRNYISLWPNPNSSNNNNSSKNNTTSNNNNNNKIVVIRNEL